MKEAEDFLRKVSEGSGRAIAHGRKMAIEHYRASTSSSQAEAETFYDAVRAIMMDCKVVLNCSVSDAVRFISSGKYEPRHPDDGAYNRHQEYIRRRATLEDDLGCRGLKPVYASISRSRQGDRGYGRVSLQLSGISGRFVCLAGDALRLVDPARPDFVKDPGLVLYSEDHMADCRASSTICSMTPAQLAGGVDSALGMVLDDGLEFGRSEAIIVGGVSSRSIRSMVVRSADERKEAQAALSSMKKFLPVYVEKSDVKHLEPHLAGTSPVVEEKPAVASSYFGIGDRVAMKPGPGRSRAMGTIIDITNGLVTVQWDGDSRTSWGMIEAMANIMPTFDKPDAEGPHRAYVLDGMDAGTVAVLSEFGIDPVNLYCIASHFRPASPMASGWQAGLAAKLADIGVQTTMQRGFRERNEGRNAFEKCEWIEARLPDHGRIVFDVGFERIRIVAGDADEYVREDSSASLTFE